MPLVGGHLLSEQVTVLVAIRAITSPIVSVTFISISNRHCVNMEALSYISLVKAPSRDHIANHWLTSGIQVPSDTTVLMWSTSV